MVSNLLKKSIDAITSKQTNIFSAALFIILTTIFSQVLGFLKYRLLVSYFGASSDVGVFFASFKIPDLLFQVIIAGALSSSFIPLFSEFIAKDKKKEAFEFSSFLLTIGVAIYCVLSLFIILFSYQLASLIAPGFSPHELELMSRLMIIIQLSQVFFIVGTLITAILQSFQHFLIPGIATAFYNLGIILGILLLAKTFGIYGVTIGVLIGSLFFFLVQIPLLLKTGFRFVFKLELTESVRKLIHLAIPRSLTLILGQVAIVADVIFASYLSSRSYGIYELAQTLVMAPVILLGQSIAQASFPSLSLKVNNREEFLEIFLNSFKQILYLTLPICALLIVLRIPVVRLFFGASRFDWKATVDTGLTLSFFSVSLFAQSLIYLLARAFYALKDTKTPFFITLFSVVINIVLAYFVIYLYRFPIYYLALCFSIANIIAAFLMTVFMDRKLPLPKLDLAYSVSKIIIAAVIMGVSVYIPIKLLDQLVFDTTRTINLLILTGIASVLGFGAYVFFTWLLDIHEATYVIRVAKRLGDPRKILKQVGEVIDGSQLNN